MGDIRIGERVATNGNIPAGAANAATTTNPGKGTSTPCCISVWAAGGIHHEVLSGACARPSFCDLYLEVVSVEGLLNSLG